MAEDNYPADIYLLKVNNRNIRTRYETCSKLTLKTPVFNLKFLYSLFVFLLNFQHISHLVLVLLLLTLNM